MSIANKISLFNRTRKYNYFLETLQPSAQNTILDIGFTTNDHSEGINYLEKHYPYPQNITALGLDGSGDFQTKFPQVKTVIYDGNIFPFEDGAFDIGWSNAVIEHVGARDKQVHFVKEMIRTCKMVYFTTPDRLFPVEIHTRIPFVHWLPKKQCDALLRRFGKAWATGNYMHLLTKRQVLSICKEAGATVAAVKHNRFMGFTMDLAFIIRK